MCLTFTAQNHSRIWGSLARDSSSPSCLQRLKKAKTKKQANKKNQKRKKEKKRKRVLSWPLLQTLRGEMAPCAWGSPGSCQADLWARRALLLSPASRCGVVVIGCRSGHVAKVVGTGQGVSHPAHLRAQQGHRWPFRSRPVGLVAHVCPQRRGQRIFLPGLQLFSKPMRISLFHSFKMPS